MSELPIFYDFRLKASLAVDVLSRSAESKKFSHAYIFHGKNTEEVLVFVKLFAKVLLCKSHTGSDNCLSCKVYEAGQHPDLRIWAADGEKSKFIKLDQVQELISENLRSPVTSHRKVLILDDVSKLRVEGSNALLKTLEEPSHFTNIILTVDSLDNVLQTILSRCQLIPVNTIQAEDIELNLLTDDYIPASFIKASELAIKYAALEVSEQINFIGTLQKVIWKEAKNKNFISVDLGKLIKMVEQLEYYANCLDKYVNSKTVMENLFIDLYEFGKSGVTK